MGWIKLVTRLFENPENIIALIGTIITIILVYYFWKYLLKIIVFILKALAIIPIWIVGLIVLLIKKIGEIGDTRKTKKIMQLLVNNEYENQKNNEISRLNEIIKTPMTRKERILAFRDTSGIITDEAITLRNEIKRAMDEDYRLNISPIKLKENNKQLTRREASRLVHEKDDEMTVLDLKELLESQCEYWSKYGITFGSTSRDSN